VIHIWQKTEKYLNFLLVFLIPTQLAIHFWPNFAFVFGIRVDYLAPSIYLSDVLLVFLFINWFVHSGRWVLWRFVKNNKLVLICTLFILLINIIFSSNIYLSLIKWAKLFEIALFAIYVGARKDVFGNEKFFLTLFISLIFFSIIGILQVINGGTLGGPLYILGERSFNLSTPGIALAQIKGFPILRAYSTFPHPNSLAGYFVVASLILFESVLIKRRFFKLGISIIVFTFTLAFSLSAFIGLLVSCLIVFLYKKDFLKEKILKYFTAFIFGFSLLFTILSKFFINTGIEFSQSVYQRFQLAYVSGLSISHNFLVGSGLNTFIPNEVSLSTVATGVWFLQPVHNIYLLVFSELGIFGFIFFFFLINRIFMKFINKRHLSLLAGLIVVMVTGLFDHYWFTIQQNMLLIGLLIGLASCHSAIKLPRGSQG
jgi:O-antigen ligase